MPREPLPVHWRAVTAEQVEALSGQCRYYIYAPGLRLDPEFWGPLLGRVDASLALPASATPSGPMTAAGRGGFPRVGAGARGAVLLPGNDGQLLHQELRTALAGCGFGPVVDALPQPSSGMSNTEPLLRLNVESRGNSVLMEEKTAEILRFLDEQGGAIPA